jgi:hypothetical protein
MELKGKALFNLLKMNWSEGCNWEVEEWQIEDLRGLNIEELFARLKKLGPSLDEESFYLYAENCNSPEELAECVWLEEEGLAGHDKVYLLLFELWRRLLPGKLCLSVFCDEIDQWIDLYDRGELEEEEPLQNALAILEDILDDAYDKKGNPQRILAEVASYCAHDLQRFICDYITDQIVKKNDTYASELIDAFYDFSEDPRRFDLLRAHLFASSDPEESNILYGRVMEELGERPDLELILLVAESLIHHGDVRLFMRAVQLALPLLAKEEEFQTLLLMVSEYYQCLDRETEEREINVLVNERSSLDPTSSLDPSDPGLARFFQIISQQQNKAPLG